MMLASMWRVILYTHTRVYMYMWVCIHVRMRSNSGLMSHHKVVLDQDLSVVTSVSTFQLGHSS